MRLIDANEAREELQKEIDKGIAPFDDTMGAIRCGLRLARNIVEDLPTIEAEPVRRGRWLHTKDGIIISGYCSECGWVSAVGETDVAGMPYCPNCGAKMEE